ncbi:NTP transferase domain-containing protein [Natrinema gelatinilyticum]|uniref:NTP transferase domain-containing protein n=1 Tax=Natrinema gelatinilyticum TaxID=2961571 RepID=UPI0020C36FC9|nr:NTP transferase domain-containing protein [Natrinema gelatinilyticum]
MSSIVGVLLAAGTGLRFDDGNKLLARFEGEPIVRHAAYTLTKSPLDRAIGIVGYEADRVRPVVADLLDETITNDKYDSGQSWSDRIAVRPMR